MQEICLTGSSNDVYETRETDGSLILGTAYARLEISTVIHFSGGHEVIDHGGDAMQTAKLKPSVYQW